MAEHDFSAGGGRCKRCRACAPTTRPCPVTRKVRYRNPRWADRVNLPGWSADEPPRDPLFDGEYYMRTCAQDKIRAWWDDHGTQHPWLNRAATLLGVEL